MTPHQAVIEAGPGGIRRLCCGTDGFVATNARVAETFRVALDAIDDPVTLIDDVPVRVDSLWRQALQSLSCARHEAVVVVHPSWWSASRVEVVRTAAASLVGEVATRRRSWLLAQSAMAAVGPPVIVEIGAGFVVVTGDAVIAESRDDEPLRVAEAVSRTVTAMTAGTAGTALIDAPGTVTGAAALGSLIAGQLRGSGTDLTVVEVDDAALCRLAAAAFSPDDEPDVSGPAPATGMHLRRRTRVLMLFGATAVGLAAAVLGGGVAGRQSVPASSHIPTTLLVEGRVALEVPAQWPTRRIVAGPGSARVQVTSPADPEIALHVTQSPVVDETLGGTAELLRKAIDAEPPGIFVDFNPAGYSAGRPAVTYREVRAGHHIWWTVLVDGMVRISIGCQSRPGDEAAVSPVCEQAVRSARALK